MNNNLKDTETLKVLTSWKSPFKWQWLGGISDKQPLQPCSKCIWPGIYWTMGQVLPISVTIKWCHLVLASSAATKCCLQVITPSGATQCCHQVISPSAATQCCHPVLPHCHPECLGSLALINQGGQFRTKPLCPLSKLSSQAVFTTASVLPLSCRNLEKKCCHLLIKQI